MEQPVPTSAVNVTETWEGEALTRSDPTNVPVGRRSRSDRRGRRLLGSTVRASGAPHVGPVFAV